MCFFVTGTFFKSTFWVTWAMLDFVYAESVQKSETARSFVAEKLAPSKH